MTILTHHACLWNVVQNGEHLLFRGCHLLVTPTLSVPTTGSVDIWGALENKGKKGAEEAWMSGPIMP